MRLGLRLDSATPENDSHGVPSQTQAPAPAEFHLKLVVAATAVLADPVGLLDVQRRELLLALRDAQRKVLDEPEGSVAGLLLEGVVLRLGADLRWLEACAKCAHALTPLLTNPGDGLHPCGFGHIEDRLATPT